MTETVEALAKNFYVCPRCGSKNPPYAFHYGGGELATLGQIDYMTIYCGAVLKPKTETTDEEQCRAILSVCVLHYLPAAEVVEAARRQMEAVLAARGRRRA